MPKDHWKRAKERAIASRTRKYDGTADGRKDREADRDLSPSSRDDKGLAQGERVVDEYVLPNHIAKFTWFRKGKTFKLLARERGNTQRLKRLKAWVLQQARPVKLAWYEKNMSMLHEMRDLSRLRQTLLDDIETDLAACQMT